MYDSFGLFINGAWTRGGTSADVHSPVTEKPLGTVSAASPADTARAIDAADAALDPLAEMGGFGRADALHKSADAMLSRTEEAAKMISTETGKPIAQSGREWALACDQFRW